jgi:hypothetical protein
MFLAGRIVAGITGLAAATLAANSFRAVGFGPAGFPVGLMIQLSLLTVAALAGWFAALGHVATERARIMGTLRVGAITAVMAFLAGFVLPLIFTQSNLGPVLGIFITGPAGFVLGCIGGFVRTRFFA